MYEKKLLYYICYDVSFLIRSNIYAKRPYSVGGTELSENGNRIRHKFPSTQTKIVVIY